MYRDPFKAYVSTIKVHGAFGNAAQDQLQEVRDIEGSPVLLLSAFGVLLSSVTCSLLAVNSTFKL